jgi:hypothetical protein
MRAGSRGSVIVDRRRSDQCFSEKHERARSPASADLVRGIEQDFRALLEFLKQEAERSRTLFGEIPIPIERAREAAERGVELSGRLVQLANKAQWQSEVSAEH